MCEPVFDINGDRTCDRVDGVSCVSPTSDNVGLTCGFLCLEQPHNSNKFVRKYFVLDKYADRFYYFAKQSDASDSSKAESFFNISYISITGDAAAHKPRIPFCLYITVSGMKHFLIADSEDEKLLWIERLQNASRVQVPLKGTPSSSLPLDPSEDSCFKVEVIGGVVLKTQIDGESASKAKLSSSSSSSLLTYDDVANVKCGFCYKQGAVRKNWKKRFFKLSKTSLQYYRTQEDDEPLRMIYLKDVIDVRLSVGIHLTRCHVFEVVTSYRVFYIQPHSDPEMRSWMSSISKCLAGINGPKIVDAGIQTDDGARPQGLKIENHHLTIPSASSSSSFASYSETFI